MRKYVFSVRLICECPSVSMIVLGDDSPLVLFRSATSA
jgi:hypothetical protein